MTSWIIQTFSGEPKTRFSVSNIQKRGLNVKKALMITNSNQIYFPKVLGREVQEGILHCYLPQYLNIRQSNWSSDIGTYPED
jgi:hypothetical protein